MEFSDERFAPERFVLLVAGASKGLGRAIAESWARPGTRIAIAARGEAALRSTRDRLVQRGAEVVALAGDVGERGFADRIVGAAETALGPVSHLCVCASSLGAVPLRPIVDVEDAQWDEAVRTNILGTVRLLRAVLPGMQGDLGGGRLLVFSSDAAVEAYPRWGPYGATKAAADHVVRVLAEELQERRVPNVYAYAVDPGDMDTDLHRAAVADADPLALARPAAVAPLILSLLLRVPPLPSGRYIASELAAGGGPR